MVGSHYVAVPDNVEFAVPTANTEVTINFFNSAGNTSANDTTTEKYTDSNTIRNRYVVGADQAITITKYNGTALTDPRTVVADKVFSETEVPGMTSITIKTEVNNTNVHCFVR